MATILGLDASSTVIGWCVLQDGRAIVHGEIKLPASNIADRCEAAQRGLVGLLECAPIDAVAIESVVWRFPNSTIPQAFVHGAILAICSLRETVSVEISPSEAKQALVSKGTAAKLAMQERAAEYGVYGEHASDALGVALALAKSGKLIIEEVV